MTSLDLVCDVTIDAFGGILTMNFYAVTKYERKLNTLNILSKIKLFLLGNIVIYNTQGQEILPKGR